MLIAPAPLYCDQVTVRVDRLHTFDQVETCFLSAFARLANIFVIPASDPDLRVAPDERVRGVQTSICPAGKSGGPLRSTLRLNRAT